MAHTSGYEDIYVDSQTPSGLSFRNEVRAALGTTESHVGRLCMDIDDQGNDAGRINPNSVRKPYRSSVPASTEAARAAAKYGWDILTKPAGSQLGIFLQTIDSRVSAGTPLWQHLKPRGKGHGDGGADEWGRIRDFDHYRRNAPELGQPLELDRLSVSSLGLTGWKKYISVPANSAANSYTFYTPGFVLRNGASFVFRAEISSYNHGTTAWNPYVDFDFDGAEVDVYLRDSHGNILLEEQNITIPDGTGHSSAPVRTMDFHLAVDIADQNAVYSGCYWQVTFHHGINNTSYSGQKFEVTFKFSFPTATTMLFNHQGSDGVFIRPKLWQAAAGWSDSPAKANLFGSNAWPIAVIRASYGGSSQSKIVMVPDGGFISFEDIGINVAIPARGSAGTLVVYLLIGNYQAIFPNYLQGTWFLPVTDSGVVGNQLFPLPTCKYDISTMSTQEPVVFSLTGISAFKQYSRSDSQGVADILVDGFVTSWAVNRILLSLSGSIYNADPGMPVLTRLILLNKETGEYVEATSQYTVGSDGRLNFSPSLTVQGGSVYDNASGTNYKLYVRFEVYADKTYYYTFKKPSSGGSPEYTTVDPGYFPIRRFGLTYDSNYNIYP